MCVIDTPNYSDVKLVNCQIFGLGYRSTPTQSKKPNVLPYVKLYASFLGNLKTSKWFKCQIVVKRGSRHAAREVEAMRLRIEQLLKCLIKQKASSSLCSALCVDPFVVLAILKPTHKMAYLKHPKNPKCQSPVYTSS